MKSSDLTGAVWRKSSRSNGQAECVELAELNDGHVAVRDSKAGDEGEALVFNRRQMRELRRTVLGG